MVYPKKSGGGKVDKQFLRSYMAKYGDTQATLAVAMGVSLSRLNAKINRTGGAEFAQTEISFIAERYKMSAKELDAVFLTEMYLKQIQKES